jgi:hypothetical protein
MRTRPLLLRLLSISLILAVGVLSVYALGHSDGDAHDEEHCTCQVCHIAHAAIPQPTAQAQLQIPHRVSRYSPAEPLSAAVEPASILSIPRAPPA